MNDTQDQLTIIETSVTQFEGRRIASNDEGTVVRYRFPYTGKAVRFRDAMIELGVSVEIQTNSPTDVVIDLR